MFKWIFNRGAKIIQWGKDNLSVNAVGITGYPNRKSEPSHFIPYTKICSKWIIPKFNC